MSKVVDLETRKLDGRTLDYSIGDSVKTAKAYNYSGTWPKIVKQFFTTPRIDDITLAEIKALKENPSPEAGRKVLHHKQANGWFGGPFTDNKRSTNNVPYRDVMTLDVDHADPETLGHIRHALDRWTYVVHSTWSHTSQLPRLRILLPLDRSVDNDEWRATMYKIMEEIGVDYFDDTTDQFGRIMFRPIIASDAKYLFVEHNNKFLEVDRYLDSYGENEAWKNPDNWPSLRHEKRKTRNARTKQHPSESSNPYVRIFCSLYSPQDVLEQEQFLGKYYVKSTFVPLRYNYYKATGCNGIAIFMDNLSIFGFSEQGPLAGGYSYNAYDAVRIGKFGGHDDKKDKIANRKSTRDMIDFCHSLKEFHEEWWEMSSDPFQDFSKIDSGTLDLDTMLGETVPEERISPGEANEQVEEIKDNLQKQGKVVKNSQSNISEILRRCSQLEGVFFMDTRTETVRVLKSYLNLPALEHKQSQRFGWGIGDRDLGHIRSWLSRAWEIEARTEYVVTAIAELAREKSINPVKHILEECGAWDGKPRVDSLLIDHLGADDTAAVREMTRVTLIGAVHRGLNPGCKFDTMLVLEGIQGIGKSLFVQALAMDKMLAGTLTIQLTDKDTIIQMNKVWINEVPELHAVLTRTSNDNPIKAIMTEPIDVVRAPYGREAQVLPRASILIGTTNETDDYLQDPSGARRFLPVRCRQARVNLPEVKTSLRQLWAEAYARYLKGEKCFTTDPELVGLISNEQSLRMQHTLTDEHMLLGLQNFFDTYEKVGDMPDYLSLEDVWKHAGETRKPTNPERRKMKKLVGQHTNYFWPDYPIRIAKYEQRRMFVRKGGKYDRSANR